MPGHDIIVVGASAGGVEAVLALTSALPADLPASVFVVIHTTPSHPSMLADIIARSSALRVTAAIDSEPIQPGHIYVAPPDNHLLVANGFVRVLRGAKENGHRPAVDPLFRTAAQTYGARVVGVVLTGMLDCGTVGLQEIKRHGGLAVVQNPSEALFPSMPQSAVDNVEIDHCLPIAQMAPLLTSLAHQPAPVLRSEVPEEVEELEAEFTCPECGGNLKKRESKNALSFGCKVGHRYSPEALVDEQAMALEAALWVALRLIEDSTALSRRLAERAEAQQQPHAAARFAERVRDGEVQSALLRQALLNARPSNGVRMGSGRSSER